MQVRNGTYTSGLVYNSATNQGNGKSGKGDAGSGSGAGLAQNVTKSAVKK